MSRNKRRDLVFGRQPVLELFRSGSPVEKVVLQRGASGEGIAELKTYCRERRVPLQQVPREALQRLCSGHHQGVLAYTASIRYQLLEDLLPFVFEQGLMPYMIVLDGVTDVRNFGAIARTAQASGAHGLVLGMRDAAPANPEAIKASAGALLQLPVCREASTAGAIESLQQHGLKVYGLEAGRGSMPWQCDLREPFAIVAGGEGEGLSPAVRELLSDVISLPMPGGFESYNVSVAVGMVAYECARQRSQG